MAGTIYTTEIPIGTPAELPGVGADPMLVASCSPPGPSNKGCPNWNRCMFTEYKGVGPEMVGVGVVLPDGPADIKILPCTGYYASGLADRRDNMHKSKEIIDPRYRVGDTVKVVRNVRLHAAVDPTCHNCKAGTCNTRKVTTESVTIKPFPRPGEVYVVSQYSEEMKNEILQGINDDRAAAVLKDTHGVGGDKVGRKRQ